MPQMNPMNWILLLIMFSMMFSLTWSANFPYKISLSSHLIKGSCSPNSNWKW